MQIQCQKPQEVFIQIFVTQIQHANYVLQNIIRNHFFRSSDITKDTFKLGMKSTCMYKILFFRSMKLTTTDFSKFYTIGTFRGIYGLGTNSKLSKYVVKLRNGVIEVHRYWLSVFLPQRNIEIQDNFGHILVLLALHRLWHMQVHF